jgi:8-oxo-dGTP pyrophosphatase MutT (NUDIX family)
MADYNKAGLLVVRDGRILLCRKKRGTSLLILPGGCIEDGETPEQCLSRELREELGDAVAARDLQYVGTYGDVAAGGDGKTVEVRLYTGELSGTPAPHSEIAELVWFGPADDRALLAPSIARKILPDLLERGLLCWPRPTPLT